MKQYGSRHDRRTRLLEALAASFGHKADAGWQLARRYRGELADMEYSALERGVRQALRECHHLPPSAEVRRFAGVPSPHELATVAWQDLYHALGRHSECACVGFEDDRTNAVVHRLGGWLYLCSLRPKDLRGRVRQEFRREYVALVRERLTRAQQRELPGVREMRQSPVIVKASNPDGRAPMQMQLLF